MVASGSYFYVGTKPDSNLSNSEKVTEDLHTQSLSSTEVVGVVATKLATPIIGKQIKAYI